MRLMKWLKNCAEPPIRDANKNHVILAAGAGAPRGHVHSQVSTVSDVVLCFCTVCRPVFLEPHGWQNGLSIVPPLPPMMGQHVLPISEACDNASLIFPPTFKSLPHFFVPIGPNTHVGCVRGEGGLLGHHPLRICIPAQHGPKIAGFCFQYVKSRHTESSNTMRLNLIRCTRISLAQFIRTLTTTRRAPTAMAAARM